MSEGRQVFGNEQNESPTTAFAIYRWLFPRAVKLVGNLNAQKT